MMSSCTISGKSRSLVRYQESHRLNVSSLSVLLLASFVVYHSREFFQRRSWYTNEMTSREITATKKPVAVRPVVTLIAGGHRTGSTYLYNIFRILMTVRDPNLISGSLSSLEKMILADKSTEAETFNRLKIIRSHGSAVLKSHELSPFRRFVFPNNEDENFLDGVDLVVLPYRNLSDQLSSRAKMGWEQLNESDSSELIRAAHSEIELHTEWESAIRKDNKWSISQPNVLEVRYEEWTGNRSKSTLDKVMHFQKFLCSSSERFENAELLMVANMVEKLHLPTCSEGINCRDWHLTNWMHVNHQHISGEPQPTSKILLNHMKNDEIIRNWMAEHGYPAF